MKKLFRRFFLASFVLTATAQLNVAPSLLYSEEPPPIFTHSFGFVAQASAQSVSKPKWKTPMAELERAVREHPDSAEAWFNLGEAERRSFSRGKAENDYKKAIELRPDYAEAYVGLGWYYQFPSECGNTYLEWSKKERDSHYDKALEMHKKALSINPDYADAYRGLGRLYTWRGRYQEAGEAYETVLRLDPNDKNSQYELGEIYMKLNRLDAAIEAFKKVVEPNSNREREDGNYAAYQFYSAYHEIAELQYKLGAYEDALATCMEIINRKIDNADTHYGLGSIFLALGNKRAALVEYEKLLEYAKKQKHDVLQQSIEKAAKDLLEKIEKQ